MILQANVTCQCPRVTGALAEPSNLCDLRLCGTASFADKRGTYHPAHEFSVQSLNIIKKTLRWPHERDWCGYSHIAEPRWRIRSGGLREVHWRQDVLGASAGMKAVDTVLVPACLRQAPYKFSFGSIKQGGDRCKFHVKCESAQASLRSSNIIARMFFFGPS